MWLFIELGNFQSKKLAKRAKNWTEPDFSNTRPLGQITCLVKIGSKLE